MLNFAARAAIWLATTRTGRFVAAAGALSVAVGIALLKAFSAGRRLEREKQDRAALNTIRQRQEIENEVNTLGHGDLDRRGRRWVRPSS